VSESRDDRPPGNSNSGPPRNSTNGQADDSRPGSGSRSNRGSDPVADFQRWLMRAGARSMANQVADQVKRSLGAEKRTSGDVWDTATNEPPPNEPPECQWCPICQAARAARTSGPGLSAMLSDAGGALASMAQDAFSAFEQLMKNPEPSAAERTVVTPPPPAPDSGEAAQ
jgi:hypothetical protein